MTGERVAVTAQFGVERGPLDVGWRGRITIVAPGHQDVVKTFWRLRRKDVEEGLLAARRNMYRWIDESERAQ